MGLLLRQAKEQGLQTQFMGAEGAFNQSLVEIAGPALEGMLFTYPADFSARAENQAIVQAFEKAQRPPTVPTKCRPTLRFKCCTKA